MPHVVNGNSLADSILEKAKGQIASFSRPPCLAIVMVGNNPASQVYVRRKEEACKKVGIKTKNIHLPSSATEGEVMEQILALNSDSSVDAILVQLPLPPHIDEERVLCQISPKKDVDGFHPENFGRAALGTGQLLPCTPKGVLHILKESKIGLAGKHAVIVGRSRIVGKPLAFLLLNEDCTVTICHSKTKNLKEVARQADILCVAVGKPRTITAEMVKEGAAVIDIGINREGEKLVGDVDFEGVKGKASIITPVPGGVGPMTVAMLIENTLLCYKLQGGK
ncbi:MAG: bifunctional methylenetetrahydrofolate dehydrogenase/methenyltetrahydrofolate cyclohydrolase FolD [Candidatus Micrarchaeota archaeon]|nr:bifunctional methylenetetrahydrofolate dehydrogenase/methenyltetrahydrofolate cyclohydrolase FolD [Candidatus Micrarchaeota archaeon]